MPKAEADDEPFQLTSSVWIGLAVAAVLGLLISVFRLVFLDLDAGLLAAAGTGGLAYYAMDRAWDARVAERRDGPRRQRLQGRAREIALAPSLEVYDPRRAEPSDSGGGPPPIE